MKLGKTVFFSALMTIIKTAAGFISSKVVAIYVGPAGLALVGQFMNFLGVTLTFANGAVNTGVVKYTAQYSAEGNDEKLKKLFSTALRITIFLSGIISICLFFGSSFFSQWIFGTPDYVGPMRALGIGLVFYAINLLLVSILNGRSEIRTYTIVNICGTVFSLVLTVILIYYYNVSGALYALAVSQSAAFFITVIILLKTKLIDFSYFKESFNREIFKNLSSYSLMAIVSALTLPIAQLFLRSYVTNHFGGVSAGYWQGVMRISDAYLLVITTALSTYYLPKLSSLKSDSEIRHEIIKGYKMIVPALLVSIGAIFLCRVLIIKILYSDEFIPMKDLFLFQLLGDFFKVCSWLLGYVLVARAQTKFYIFIEISFTIIFVALSVFLMNIIGLKGIVFSFFVNNLIFFFIMLFLLRNIFIKK